MYRLNTGSKDLLKIAFVVFAMIVMYHEVFHSNAVSKVLTNKRDTVTVAVIEEEQRVQISLPKNSAKAAKLKESIKQILKNLNQQKLILSTNKKVNVKMVKTPKAPSTTTTTEVQKTMKIPKTTKLPTTKKLPTTTKTPTTSRDYLGVISYIPNSESHARQYLAFAYASWRHITDKEEKLLDKNITNELRNSIDLLAFCHPNICPHLEQFCTKITNISKVHNAVKQKCWAVEQPFETDIRYGPLNSYIMFKRRDVTELSKKYKYLLRTDNDVFISPALFLLKPTNFLFGRGGYSDPFNMKRLKEVSKRLGMTHRGRHGIGSTWCAETKQFIAIANKTYDTTRYVWLNEFNPKAQGLETINFTKNIEGEWIRWWRPVSLLYGGEIAINHMLPQISDQNQGRFDDSSCSTESIWKAYHIHCWHSPCHFSKFEFDNFINNLLHGTKDLSNKLSKELVRNSYDKDTRNMTMQQFSSYIAYNAIGKYLGRYFQN
eukprot:TCONS_00073164-protein